MSLSEKFYFGYLTFEEVRGTDALVRRFFVLNTANARLEYYADDSVENESTTRTDYCLGHFSTRFISFVSESSSSKKKLPHAFVVVISGDRYQFGADSELEKANWIQVLQDASRLAVPEDPDVVLVPQRNGCQVEIVGGVAHATALQDVPQSASNVYQRSVSCYSKAGYCVKQGVVRKNWKRRYFVLDCFVLSYYNNRKEKSPIRSIHVKDIKEARVSVGIHPNKQNVFEVVTPLRVFYLQVESAVERDSWIEAVNAVVKLSNDVKSRCRATSV